MHDDIIWRYVFFRDFGELKVASSAPSEEDSSWMKRYRYYYETPRWDPNFLDDEMKLSEDNTKVTRLPSGRYGKALIDRPINIRRSHTIHMRSNVRITFGLFATPSKEDLHATLCKPLTCLSTRLHLHLGRAAVLHIYRNSMYIKKDASDETTTNQDCNDNTPPGNKYRSMSFKNLCDQVTSAGYEVREVEVRRQQTQFVDIKLHIDAEKRVVRWEVYDQIIATTPLPFPDPVFLLYQSGEYDAAVTLHKTTYYARGEK